MLIESKIKRPGGTRVPMPSGIEYHFKPESESAEARHLCEVENEDDLARFLAIPEGYKIARVPGAPAPVAASAPAQVAEVKTAAPQPTSAPTPAPAPAPEVPGASDGTDGEATDYLIEGDNGEEIDLGKMTRAELETFAKANAITLPAAKELKKLDDKAVLELVFKAVTAE